MAFISSALETGIYFCLATRIFEIPFSSSFSSSSFSSCPPSCILEAFLSLFCVNPKNSLITGLDSTCSSKDNSWTLSEQQGTRKPASLLRARWPKKRNDGGWDGNEHEADRAVAPPKLGRDNMDRQGMSDSFLVWKGKLTCSTWPRGRRSRWPEEEG
uniref:Uncharacterized protein LOC105126210 isoform X1 n=1 Tax=Rhizophora mucronata TaxID=61149 RepID=A0A2P2LBS7_RHIMU